MLLLGQGSKLSLGGGRDHAGMLEDWDHGGQEVRAGSEFILSLVISYRFNIVFEIFNLYL